MPPHGLDRFLPHDLLAVKTDPLLGKRLGNIATGHGPEETILIPRRPGEGQDETPEPFRDAVGLLADPPPPLSPVGLELLGGAGVGRGRLHSELPWDEIVPGIAPGHIHLVPRLTQMGNRLSQDHLHGYPPN